MGKFAAYRRELGLGRRPDMRYHVGVFSRARRGQPMTRPLATRFNCPTEFALTVLGGKWKTIILAYLSERPCHYGELRQLLPGLSDKVLTERLKDLKSSGLIARDESSPAGARRPYVLTARGATLTPILTDLYAWGAKHAASFGVTVDNPLQKLDGSECGT
jgi:DNA-binding HxlR family transcriptional regulator